MRTVTVNKNQLKGILATNRDNHRAIFEEALEGWHKACVAELERQLELARSNKIQLLQVYLPRPEDHTDDYDIVIRMLDMSVDDTIELLHNEFENFVCDEWGWKNAWMTSNSGYSDTIATKLAI